MKKFEFFVTASFENERRYKINKYVDFPLLLDTTVVGGKDSVRGKFGYPGDKCYIKNVSCGG